MTFKAGQHIYLAAPFFNDEQKALCSFIERLATDHNPIYSPRLDGGVLRPDSSNEKRQEIFESNTDAIDNAAWVLAVVDDFDAGVLWEMGYAWGAAAKTLGFSGVEGRGLNVMLAGSCDLGFVNGTGPLEEVFHQIKIGYVDPFPRNTWRGEIQ